MAQVSISKAAKLAGKARSHFYTNYINSGKITVSTDEEGKKFIDTAELIRVFGTLKGTDSKDSPCGVLGDGTEHHESAYHGEKGRHERQLQDTLKALLEEKERHIKLLGDELGQARQREQWLREQLESATKLVEHKQSSTKKGFWKRLFVK